MIMAYGFILLLSSFNLGLLIWGSILVRQTMRLNRLLRAIALQSFMTQHRGTFYAWTAMGHYEVNVSAVQHGWREENNVNRT